MGRESWVSPAHVSRYPRLSRVSFSLLEAIRIAQREVSPNARNTFEHHATVLWLHYVKDEILLDWVMACPSHGDEEPAGSRAVPLTVVDLGSKPVVVAAKQPRVLHALPTTFSAELLDAGKSL